MMRQRGLSRARALALGVMLLGILLMRAGAGRFRGRSPDAADVLMMLIGGAFLIGTGALVLFYGTTPQRRRTLLFSYMALFISLAVVEAGLHVLVAVARPRSLVADKGMYEYLIDNPIFRSQPDAEYFLREWSDTRMVFKPFLVWDREPFHGKYFNVSSDGVRQTWNPIFDGGQKPSMVYTFGGSTMWGSGVCDDCTIASYLSKILNESQARYEVVNYGDVGYSFTQEVVQLMLLLRDGHRPEYAVFYDGVNDIYAGYQAGRPELIINADMLSAKMQQDEPTALQMLGAGIKKTIRDHFMLYKSFRLAVGKFVKPFPEPAAHFTPEQIDRLAAAIDDSYAKTYGVLESLSKIYGFEFICFWQPSGHLEKKLFDEEYNSHPRFKDKTLKELSQKTTQAVLKDPPQRLFDLTDALNERPTYFYFDSMHLCADGNKMVAEKMADVVKRELLNEEMAIRERTGD